MEILAKKWLLLGAVVLTSIRGQTAPTIYTIPGTSVQITISSTSTDPQYQLTSAEITQQLLPALARYPESQLQGLKSVQEQPPSSAPAPGAISTTGVGYIIIYLPSLTSRQISPYNFNSTFSDSMGDITWGGLTYQQQQEWAALNPGGPPPIFSFSQAYGYWAYESYIYSLNPALASDDPAQIGPALFMAGVFTNWPTNQVFLYPARTSAVPWPPPDRLTVTVTSTLVAFGSSYQFFLKNGMVTGYQIGTGSQVNLPTPVTLPSAFASELPISQQFTRARHECEHPGSPDGRAVRPIHSRRDAGA